MKTLLTLLMLMLTLNLNAQKGNFLAGMEGGANIAANAPYNTLSAQGGLVGEYRFARQWSVVGKIKWNRGDASYHRHADYKTTRHGMGPDFSGMFDGNYFDFDYSSQNIIVPINVKWNFRIYKDFSGYIDNGYYLNFMLSSRYNISKEKDVKNPKVSLGYNAGAGLSYRMKSGNTIYADYHFYPGESLITLQTLVWDTKIRMMSHHISVGYLWLLKQK